MPIVRVLTHFPLFCRHRPSTYQMTMFSGANWGRCRPMKATICMGCGWLPYIKTPSQMVHFLYSAVDSAFPPGQSFFQQTCHLHQFIPTMVELHYFTWQLVPLSLCEVHGGYVVLKKPLYILALESIAQSKKEGVICHQGFLLGRCWALTSRILVPQSDQCDSCTNNMMLVCIQGLVVHDILKAEK